MIGLWSGMPLLAGLALLCRRYAVRGGAAAWIWRSGAPFAARIAGYCLPLRCSARQWCLLSVVLGP